MGAYCCIVQNIEMRVNNLLCAKLVDAVRPLWTAIAVFTNEGVPPNGDDVPSFVIARS